MVGTVKCRQRKVCEQMLNRIIKHVYIFTTQRVQSDSSDDKVCANF